MIFLKWLEKNRCFIKGKEGYVKKKYLYSNKFFKKLIILVMLYNKYNFFITCP